MNQKANDQGSDGKNAPTVNVKAGSTKNQGGFNTGQKKPQFSNSTKFAK